MPADARVGVIALTTSGDGSADEERFDIFLEELKEFGSRLDK